MIVVVPECKGTITSDIQLRDYLCLERVTNLTLKGNEITDAYLHLLETFVNVKVLIIKSCYNIRVIPGTLRCTTLRCYNNQLTALPALPSCTTLGCGSRNV